MLDQDGVAFSCTSLYSAITMRNLSPCIIRFLLSSQLVQSQYVSHLVHQQYQSSFQNKSVIPGVVSRTQLSLDVKYLICGCESIDRKIYMHCTINQKETLLTQYMCGFQRDLKYIE